MPRFRTSGKPLSGKQLCVLSLAACGLLLFMGLQLWDMENMQINVSLGTRLRAGIQSGMASTINWWAAPGNGTALGAPAGVDDGKETAAVIDEIAEAIAGSGLKAEPAGAAAEEAAPPEEQQEPRGEAPAGGGPAPADPTPADPTPAAAGGGGQGSQPQPSGAAAEPGGRPAVEGADPLDLESLTTLQSQDRAMIPFLEEESKTEATPGAAETDADKPVKQQQQQEEGKKEGEEQPAAMEAAAAEEADKSALTTPEIDEAAAAAAAGGSEVPVGGRPGVEGATPLDLAGLATLQNQGLPAAGAALLASGATLP